MPNAVITQLGYIGIGTPHIESWRTFTDLLGAVVTDSDDGGLAVRIDSDRHARLWVHPADVDGLLYAGWQVAGPAALDAVVSRLSERGVVVEHVDGDKTLRGVEELIRFHDPDGNPCEVYWGMASAMREQFISPRGVEFATGDLGAGHLTFGVRDFRSTLDFYTEALGMKVTEIADVGGARVGFLRCNPRHHSVAFAELPSGRSRLMHLSIEVAQFDALGSIRDRLLNTGFPVGRDLGRHPTDGVISLYANPSPAFEFELGWGSTLIDDETWETDRYERAGWSWGHREVTGGAATSLGTTEKTR